MKEDNRENQILPHIGASWRAILIGAILVPVNVQVKWIILRQGGLKMHRKAIWFFLGLILGEFVIGSIWSLIGVGVGRPMYRFLY